MPKIKKVKKKTDSTPYSRPKRLRKVSVDGLPTHFESPSYTLSSVEKAGGTSSTAVLGPNGFKDWKSDADPSLPRGIKEARDTYPEAFFKAGHLLNANFGGSGTTAANLTILSAAGNGSHKGFDNNVVRAVGSLKRLYELLANNYVDVARVRYGIAVKVETSGQWGSDTPDSYICEELVCSAKMWGKLDLNDLQDTNGGEIDRSGFEDDALLLQAEIQSHLHKARKRIENSKP
jgi:hypothetical protein